MKSSSSNAFTLVELIVVIAILAILWTIGFISLQWYTRDARNSARISDMKTIQKWFDVHIASFWAIPLPDESVTISYSGGTAWHQWVFGENAQASIKRVTSVPVDPTYGIQYAYSTIPNRRYYQLSGIFEGGGLFSQSPLLVEQTYAISNNKFTSYNIWNYIDYDTIVTHEDDCFVITTPSIILSDIPAGWVLENNTPYNYSYTSSPHIVSTFSWSINNTNVSPGFQNIEVYSGCELNSIVDLEIYNAEISTAYQQLLNLSRYEDLIFNSRSNKFMLQSAISLQDRWIVVDDDVIQQLIYPTPLQTFTDIFTDPDGTSIVWSHTSDSWGIWDNIPGWNSSSYIVSSNQLAKDDNSTSKIYPRPNPNIVLGNYTINATIESFSGGSISIYLRYLDNDNYYRVELRNDGYIIYRNLDGTEVAAANVTGPSETIALWSEVIFSVDWDSLALSIAGTPKWNIVLWGINGVGNPALWLENTWARIDNFSLTYR